MRVHQCWHLGSATSSWAVARVGLWLWGRRGQEQNLARGSLHPAPGEATCATFHKPPGRQAQWKYNGIIDGPLLLGLI